MTAARELDIDRDRWRAMADVLIPSGSNLPSACDVDVAGRGLDRVLAARPDLRDALQQVLEGVSDGSADDAVSRLRDAGDERFDVLTFVVASAYLTDSAVREQLGWRGQQANPVDEHTPIDREAPLIAPVIARGDRWRDARHQQGRTTPAT